jgi:hypothetical protein
MMADSAEVLSAIDADADPIADLRPRVEKLKLVRELCALLKVSSLDETAPNPIQKMDR